MPAKKRLGFDEHEGIAPEREHGWEGYQNRAVRGAELWLDSPGNDQELMAEECVLREEFLLGAREVSEEPPGHAAVLARNGRQGCPDDSTKGGCCTTPDPGHAREAHRLAVPQDLLAKHAP